MGPINVSIGLVHFSTNIAETFIEFGLDEILPRCRIEIHNLLDEANAIRQITGHLIQTIQGCLESRGLGPTIIPIVTGAIVIIVQPHLIQSIDQGGQLGFSKDVHLIHDFKGLLGGDRHSTSTTGTGSA